MIEHKEAEDLAKGISEICEECGGWRDDSLECQDCPTIPPRLFKLSRAYLDLLDKLSPADGELGKALELAIPIVENCENDCSQKDRNMCNTYCSSIYESYIVARSLLASYAENEKLKALVGFIPIAKSPTIEGRYVIRVTNGKVYDDEIGVWLQGCDEFQAPELHEDWWISHYMLIPGGENQKIIEPPESEGKR
jgi:hypothetical protein